MFELVEKVLFTGLGALAMSQKKAEELATELKEKYRLSEEEGKAFLEKLQNYSKESREKMTEMAEAEVRKVIDRIGLVTKSDYDELLKRVTDLEQRLMGGSGE
jgi:polyhydroxyalkanoate synthesis regulator phasin